MNTTRLNPALVAERPITLWRYTGSMMLSPMIAPQPNVLAAIEYRTIGLVRMEIGMSGSGAVARRMTKKAPIASAKVNSARTGNEVQAKRTPPMLSASMNDTLATTISIAPAMSRRCGRSYLGSRRNKVVVITSAARPIGRFIQKMTDQCRCSAMNPPSAGPQPPAVV